MAKFNIKSLFKSHKLSLKLLFFYYNFLAVILLVIFVFLLLFSFKKQHEINSNLLQLYNFSQQINKLEKEQIFVFAEPYTYINDLKYLELKRQISELVNEINSLKKFKVIGKSEFTNKIISELNAYHSDLQKIIDLNVKIYSPSEGKKSIIESIFNQLKFSVIYNKPPFDEYTDQLFTLYNQLNSGKISIEAYQNKINEILDDINSLNDPRLDFQLAKQKYIILIKNLTNTLSEYYILLDEYGKPYSYGAFKQLNETLAAIRLNVNQLIDHIQKTLNKQLNIITFHMIGLIVMVILILLLYLFIFYARLYPDLHRIDQQVARLNIGDLTPGSLSYSSLETFSISSHINRLISNLSNRKNIIDSLAKGDYNIDIKLLSNVDQLGQSLIALRDNLNLKQKQAEESKQAEDKQRWITEGMAFLAEKMRVGSQSLDQLFELTIKGLLDFIKAPMGAFYYKTIENNETFYKLKIAYAYNKKRIPKVKYRLTEGYIGTTAAEKRIIIIDEIPDNYIFYETAFGYGKPNHLAFVPVVLEDDVIGVIEIATVDPLEEHHIQLIEKFASDFSTTIKFVQINEQTRKLVQELKEQTQQFEVKEKEFEQKIEHLNKEKEQIQKELEQYKHLCRTKEEVIAQKVEENLKLKEKIKQKENELEEALERLEKIEDHYKDRIQLLESQIEGLLVEIEKLRKQNKNG